MIFVTSEILNNYRHSMLCSLVLFTILLKAAFIFDIW